LVSFFTIQMTNHELQLAWDFVNQTQRNIFLTGKAGTGKTTFLHRLKKESPKRLAIVAPTGVAAINARGVTIHSFFQMPFGPILPDQQIRRDFKQKFSKQKINLIKSLDLLIIDEISMVRADLLDAIDKTLRRYKNRNKVFGGVQVLMIGDLQQLAPVVKQHEWEMLQKYYETPYFFSSQSFLQANAINIELKNIYRQQDQDFISILNEIRDNKLSPEAAHRLNSRYIPGFNPDEKDDYITLTTHNYKAKKINQEKLDALKERTYHFHAYIEGYFPENSFPNDEDLVLKKGAQVMFIKNDSSGEKRYYNGKIGRITFIDDKNIYVKCPGDTEEIDVSRETWENITYEIDKDTKQISEKTQGTFTQIPLRLAWAITIHKSQGLTFEKAIIDAELSFAHGQTYVALSRCKSLDGLVLTAPIKTESIINDRRVTGFIHKVAEQQPGEKELNQSKKNYFIENISELFDYTPLLFPVNRLLHIYQENKSVIQGNMMEPLQNLKTILLELTNVSKKFVHQIQQMTKQTTEPEKDSSIQDRINKAKDYYLQQTDKELRPKFLELVFETDNKQIQKDLQKFYDELAEQLAQKIYILKHLKIPFEIYQYLDVRAKAFLNKADKPKKKKTIPKNITHIDLLEALRDLRSELAYLEEVPAYQIFTQESLYQMCEQLPATEKQLKKINGIGKVRFQKYGQQILDTIINYCIANEIPLKEDSQISPKLPQTNTKQISFDLFKDGKDVNEIAKERNLTTETIMRHLMYFVEEGVLDITDLIPEERYHKITQIIAENDFENLTELKKIAGDDYTWDELRYVLKINVKKK